MSQSFLLRSLFIKTTLSFGVAMGLSACLSSSVFSAKSSPAESLPQAAAVVMQPVFSKGYDHSIKGLISFDKNNIVVGSGSTIELIDAKDFSIKKIIREDGLSISGSLGFINGNKLYAGYYDRKTSQFKFKVYAANTGDKLYSHEFEYRRAEEILANETFVIYNETLLNWQTGQTYLAERQARSNSVYLTSDSYVVSAEFNGWIRVDNPVTGDRAEWDAGSGDFVFFLMDTPDHQYLVTTTTKGYCRVWKRGSKPVATGTCGEAINKKKWYVGMASLPEHYQFTITAGPTLKVYQIDPVSGKANLNMDIQTALPVVASALSNNQRVAMSTKDNRVEVWDLSSLRRIATYQPDEAMTKALSHQIPHWSFGELHFSPDGKTLLVGTTDYLIALNVPQ